MKIELTIQSDTGKITTAQIPWDGSGEGHLTVKGNPNDFVTAMEAITSIYMQARIDRVENMDTGEVVMERGDNGDLVERDPLGR